jgi:hypothetical protein
MDPTPFPEKDLDRKAEEFICGWATDLPKHLPILLLIHLTRASRCSDPAKIVQDGVRTYFKHKAEVIRRRLLELFARGRWSLAVGLVFLALCLGAADLATQLGTSPLLVIFRESLIIGGWVGMWRPLEIFLYDWWPLRHERNVCLRLSEATVEVVVRVDQTSPAVEDRLGEEAQVHAGLAPSI